MTALEAPSSLSDTILGRLAALLHGAQIDPREVTCEITDDGVALDVTVSVPGPTSKALDHALGVRVLDAVRSAPGTHGYVDVRVVHRGGGL